MKRFFGVVLGALVFAGTAQAETYEEELLSAEPQATAPGAGADPAESLGEIVQGSSRCAGEGRDQLLGPATIGAFHDAEFARARRACLRNEFGFGIHGAPVIDAPDFYGNISAAGVLYGSYGLSDTLEVFGAIELARFDYVVNATLTSTKVSLGQTTAGLAWNAIRTTSFVLTPTARLLVPTSLVPSNVRTTGLEFGAAASLIATRWLELHGHLGVQGTVGLSAGPMLPWGGVFTTVGASVMPFTWGALVLDLQVHAGERAALDYVAPALALRFNPWRTLNVEAGASVPLGGEDRHLLIGGLRLGYAL